MKLIFWDLHYWHIADCNCVSGLDLASPAHNNVDKTGELNGYFTTVTDVASIFPFLVTKRMATM